MSGVAYLDASAIAKLVKQETETDALERDATEREGLVCSRLGATEVSRTIGRPASAPLLQRLEDIMASIVFVDITTPILEDAGTLAPSDLRTLDAIHVATAQSLNIPDLDFITYDDRMARAARAHGLRVVQPGATASRSSSGRRSSSSTRSSRLRKGTGA
jgi:predicted nucleic acid-binding protein